ncbi:reverse transcriptase [Tanacetum coccineum]
MEIKKSMNAFLVAQNKVSGEINKLKSGEGTSNNTRRDQNTSHGVHKYGRIAKIEFPKFSGEDVKGWLFRCIQFFKMDDVADENRVELVSMHVYDKALIWHQQFCKRFGEDCPWNMYQKEVLKRFGLVFDDPLMELKKLKQDGTVKDYQQKFEALLNMVELEEKHAISLFLGGLKSEISLQIRMFTLHTLTEAFYMAKMQEQTLVALKSRYTPLLPTPSPKSNNNVAYGSRTNSVPVKPNTSYNKNPNRTRLTQKEYEEKRASNMCFYCDQKYVPGHKCAGQLYSLIVIGENEKEVGIEEEIMEVENDCDEIVETDIGMQFSNESPPQISLNALTGVNNFQTMRVKGYIGKQQVHILVDGGSTHNFLDLQTAKKLGCKMKRTCPLLVSVANGQDMTTTSMCQQLALTLGNMTYEIDVMVLPLAACEMVLGVQWLASLGDIRWNFQKLTMSFTYKKQHVMLRGTPQATLQWMHGNKVHRGTLMMCICSPMLLHMETKEWDIAKVESVVKILRMCLPTELPPKRSHDHPNFRLSQHSTMN